MTVCADAVLRQYVVSNNGGKEGTRSRRQRVGASAHERLGRHQAGDADVWRMQRA